MATLKKYFKNLPLMCVCVFHVFEDFLHEDTLKGCPLSHLRTVKLTASNELLRGAVTQWKTPTQNDSKCELPTQMVEPCKAALLALFEAHCRAGDLSRFNQKAERLGWKLSATLAMSLQRKPQDVKQYLSLLWYTMHTSLFTELGFHENLTLWASASPGTSKQVIKRFEVMRSL